MGTRAERRGSGREESSKVTSKKSLMSDGHSLIYYYYLLQRSQIINDGKWLFLNKEMSVLPEILFWVVTLKCVLKLLHIWDHNCIFVIVQCFS